MLLYYHVSQLQNQFPLISVIIPTYNYADFLPRAISSVLAQPYTHLELIIIDDGSTDNTAEVIPSDPVIRYFFQPNKGLSAARNAGIAKAKGKYFLFLDADDWLESDALSNHVATLTDDPKLAFVSGNYKFWNMPDNIMKPVISNVSSDHYTWLLKSNYIGMHAAVLFNSWVFDKIQYDESLHACEDYDLYLRIARNYPIAHSPDIIANYYFHKNGLSHNHLLMKEAVKQVLLKQKNVLQSADEVQAWEIGIEQWRMYDETVEALELNKHPG